MGSHASCESLRRGREMPMTNEDLSTAIRDTSELMRHSFSRRVSDRLFDHLESLLEEQSRRASQPTIPMGEATRVIMDDPAFRELGGTESED